MPELRTHDGVRLEWSERGSGRDAVLVPYWGMHPSVFERLAGALEGDHRLISYDDRGTGRSEAVGPYDMETSSADLAAVCEAAGASDAVAICMVDAGNRAVRVADARPDLFANVVCIGGAPLPLSAFASSEGMISSSTVVGAFRQMIETDFRGAFRSMLADTNTQLTEEALRERVAMQVEYSPQEPTVERLNAWASDEEGVTVARRIGPRLHMLLSPNAGGGWFPEVSELRRVIERELPDARITEVEDGIVTAPGANADAIRAIGDLAPSEPDYHRQA